MSTACAPVVASVMSVIRPASDAPLLDESEIAEINLEPSVKCRRQFPQHLPRTTQTHEPPSATGRPETAIAAADDEHIRDRWRLDVVRGLGGAASHQYRVGLKSTGFGTGH